MREPIDVEAPTGRRVEGIPERKPVLGILAHRRVILAAITAALAALPAARTNSATEWRPEDDLARAQSALERHNYQSALEAAEAALSGALSDDDRKAASVIRARSLIGLKRFDEGVAALLAQMAAQAELEAQVELHRVLADVANEAPGFAYLGVDHWERIAAIHQDRGDRDAAARALIERGRAFVRFSPDQWSAAKSVDLPKPPDDWEQSRRLQRGMALNCYDRAQALEPAPAVVIEALEAKASLLTREMTMDDKDIDAGLAVYAAIIDLDPPAEVVARTWFTIAEILETRRQNYAEAVEHYQKAIDAAGAGVPVARRAKQRMDRIGAPMLHIRAASPVATTAKSEIHWQTRNIGTIDFSVYRVDLDALMQFDEQPRRLAEWRPASVLMATWTYAVPDDGQYRMYSSNDAGRAPSTFPITDPGAYVVVAKAAGLHGGSARQVVQITVSDIVALAQTGRQQSVLWVVDGKTGDPIAKAQVRAKAGRGGIDAQGHTDDAGVFTFHQPAKPSGSGDDQRLTYWVKHGEHLAACASNFSWWGGDAFVRTYTFTDRPVYRPGQTVFFKHVVRRSENGEYQTTTNKKVITRIRGPQGEMVLETSQASNADGSVSGSWAVPSEPVLGLYRMEVEIDGQTIAWGNEGAQFRVEEYRKPEFEVTVSPGQSSYRLGEVVQAEINARYMFGDPVAGADVAYTVFRSTRRADFRPPFPCPWLFDDGLPLTATSDRMTCYWPWPEWDHRRDLVATGSATTGADGKATVTFTAEPFEQTPDRDLTFTIEAEVTDNSQRTIVGGGSVNVARRPFAITLVPRRNAVTPGDTVHVDITALDANNRPVAFEGTVEVYRLRSEIKEGVTTYSLGERVHEERIEVGVGSGDTPPQPPPGTGGGDEAEFPAGRGSGVPPSGRPLGVEGPGGAFRWVADESGPFRIVVRADAPQEPEALKPTGQCDVWVAKTGQRADRFAFRDVELVLDKPYYEQGDTAKVLIHTRRDRAYVLLTLDADELSDQRIVVTHDGMATVDVPITRRHAPNFGITAALVADHQVFMDQRDVTVPPTHQLLSVAIDVPAGEFRPSSTATARITVRDHAGKPAAAEVAVMALDSSVYYIQPEFREAVEKFFYGQRRQPAVSIGASTDTAFDGYAAKEVSGRINRMGTPLAEGTPAPMAARMDMALGMEVDAKKEAAGGFVQPTVRKDFADTIVWMAHARTDDDGRLEVEVPFPDNLTTWRLHAVAVDRDTRVGQASRDMVTSKEVLARLIAPRFLVQGDRAELSVIAHNDTDGEIEARVSLKASAYLKWSHVWVDGDAATTGQDGAVTVNVPARGDTQVAFRAEALDAGWCELTATVVGRDDGDAVQITLPVLPYGADRLLAEGGVIRDGDEARARTVTMTLPAEMDPTSPLMEIHISPSIAAVMIDALPYLFEYPYGCTEQTMSRFLPAVMARRAMQQMGIDLGAVKAKIDAQGGSSFDPRRPPGRFGVVDRARNPVFDEKAVDSIIKAGLDRLLSMQQGDGGWGWWQNDESNPYMTAYVVYGLAEARAADVAVDAAALARGAAFLKKRLTDREPVSRYAWAADDDNVRAWTFFALSTVGGGHLNDTALSARLTRLFDDRDGLTDYARAMLAIVFHRLGDAERAKVLIENFENTVRVDAETKTASWGRATDYWHWHDNGLETTAMVLRALLAAAPDHEWVPQAVNWIVRNRRGMHWTSTKDTAFAVYALGDYLMHSGELDPDMTVEVSLDGALLQTFRINKDNAFSADAALIIEYPRLDPGEHRVQITRSGRGNAYYNVYLDYYNREHPIPATGNEIYVTRTYHRLTPKEVERTRRVYDPKTGQYVEEKYRDIEFVRSPLADGEALAPGDLIEAELSVDARNNYEYVMFVDPKPAGCEPVALRSGSAYGDGFYGHVELGDEEVAFFATYLPQGRRTVSYLLRCETPGTFHALPTRVEAMYAPFVRGSAESDTLTIATLDVD